jgi:NADH-quinone oxidoreductase subunit N
MNTPIAYETVKQTLLILAPEVLTLLAAVSMITAAAFVKLSRQTWCGISAGVLAVALLVLITIRNQQVDLYSAVALNDAFSFYARALFLVTGLILLGMAIDEPDDGRAGEFFGAILMLNAGAMLVAAANEIVFLFVAMELVSIPTYVLLYLTRRTDTTREAATKYFFLSIFASALFLYGLAFLYGLTGLSNLKSIAFLNVNSIGWPQSNLALIAILFVLAGLSFRVASVPFHFYAPDVYEGSPTVIAALLSWIPKAIGFLAILRALTVIFAPLGQQHPVVQKAIVISWVVAAATMTLGNTVALLQENLKRLLAYSSIAHAGYLMVGITVAFSNGQKPLTSYHGPYLGSEGVLFYLVAYSFMTLGAFGVIIALRKENGRAVETVDDLSGLGRTQPLPAIGLAICLMSLLGFPFLAGFWGKFQIFMSAFAVEQGASSKSFILLAVIAVINAAIGAYYYLRIVVTMYFRPAREALVVRGGWPMGLAVGTCVALTLLIGLIPAPVANATKAAAFAAWELPSPTEQATPNASLNVGVRR